MQQALRVYLADDHPIVLAGVKALVLAEAGLDVIGEARDGLTALAEATALQPDILVLDISMPGLLGTKLAEQLRTACPDCKVMALSVHEDRGYLRQLLEVGVVGYVLKRSAGEDLIRAIRIVAAGGIYIDPEMSTKAFGESQSGTTDRAVGDLIDLSKREIDVLRLMAAGHSSKAVATELQIGVKTVETYNTRAFETLGFQSRVELVRYALSKGWLDSN